MDPNSIVAAVEGIRRASSIAKALISSEATLEKAELRLRLADLVTSLADARQALADAADGLASRDAEIARLEEALKMKGEVERRGDAYFLTKSGEAFGDALCTYCWEQNHRLIHLTTKAGSPRERICPHCKHVVNWTRIRWPKGSNDSDEPGSASSQGRTIRN